MLIALAACSCHGKVYNLVDTVNCDKKSQEIVLDKSYTLYVRTVYKQLDQQTQNYGLLTDRKDTTSMEGLIEIQYIFFSQEKGNLLYISTVPDKYQRYYQKHLLGINKPNAYDFNTFYFGQEIGDGLFEFKGPSGAPKRWIVEKADDELRIDHVTAFRRQEVVNEITVGYALKTPLIFYCIDNGKIHHFTSGNDDAVLRELKSHTIVACSAGCNKRKCSTSLYFTFDPIAQETDSSNTAEQIIIKFGPERVRSLPFH